MPDATATAAPANVGVMAALALFIVASIALGLLAHESIRGKSFLRGYFQGNRGLGSWAVALTATVQSGGTFMGFPSLVYTHGWIVALWIASYMVVPITAFSILGKRFAQLSRRTGAITVPDFFRARYNSPELGLVASLLIIFYMTFMMVAQFKAGAIVMKLAWPTADIYAAGAAEAVPAPAASPSGPDAAYLIGLVTFTLIVLGYTLVGGFLAAVWTDLFQSILMLVGVLILFPLAVSAAGGMQAASLRAAENAGGANFLFGPGQGPDGRLFHPLGLAISYFFVWVFAGFGSPASMVRVMACKDTPTLRRSIFLLASYNTLIYLPLVAICIAARAVLPSLPVSDEVIPRMAVLTTREFSGGSFLAGLILSAPFGAVMATVSAYLVVIASGLVQDIYHRFLDPGASARRLKRVSYLVMAFVAAVGILANIRPVAYLQVLVVFSGTGTAAAFVFPAIMAAYWRRSTAKGVMAGMFAGALTMVGLFTLGSVLAARGVDQKIGVVSAFRPYYLLGLEPVVWGLAASLVAGVVVSLLTARPEPELVAKYFGVPSMADRQEKP